MLYPLTEAVRDCLEEHGLDDVWWGAAILQAWRRVASERCAANAAPILEKSDIRERGLLVIRVSSSSWRHELSFMDIRGAMNRALGHELIKRVSFDL